MIFFSKNYVNFYLCHHVSTSTGCIILYQKCNNVVTILIAKTVCEEVIVSMLASPLAKGCSSNFMAQIKGKVITDSLWVV